MEAGLISTLWALFVIGLTLGISQCMLTCAPVLAFYLSGTVDGWQSGLRATIVFSVARMLAYTILGALAGGVGVCLLPHLEEGTFTSWVQLSSAAFILLLGILIIMGHNPHLRLCQYLNQYTLKNTTLSMALLGFLTGIAPYCAPFLGVLTYIAFAIRDILLGALCGLAFGLGAAFITPLLVIGPIAGMLPKLFKSPFLLEVFRRASGVILLLLSIQLALTAGERL